MKKLLLFSLVFALTLTLGFGVALAGPSAKFTASVSEIQLVPWDPTDPGDDNEAFGWATVLVAHIKTPNKADLLVGASFETALFTRTLVKGKNGSKDTSTADAKLLVRLVVTPAPEAESVCPSEVVYDRRVQTLSAVLGGVIETCEDTGTFSVVYADGGWTCEETLDEGNPILDGVITVKCECDVLDEEIELILDTMAAHHFNFVIQNLSSGDHTIEVQVKIETSGTKGEGDYEAYAGVGRGSLTIEQVRATNSPDGISFDFGTP